MKFLKFYSIQVLPTEIVVLLAGYQKMEQLMMDSMIPNLLDILILELVLIRKYANIEFLYKFCYQKGNCPF